MVLTYFWDKDTKKKQRILGGYAVYLKDKG